MNIKEVLKYFKILESEEKTLNVQYDEILKEMHINVMGKIQLEVLKEIIQERFNLNVEYTPSRLYELAKMDGAIILSADLKRILYANAQLIPSYQIPTVETGTRHRTAERTVSAKYEGQGPGV